MSWLRSHWFDLLFCLCGSAAVGWLVDPWLGAVMMAADVYLLELWRK